MFILILGLLLISGRPAKRADAFNRDSILWGDALGRKGNIIARSSYMPDLWSYNGYYQ